MPRPVFRFTQSRTVWRPRMSDISPFSDLLSLQPEIRGRITDGFVPDAHSLTRRRGGVTYQLQRYFVGNQEYLYLVTFCLPRFLDQSFADKLLTLFHELYHISPAFDGDLRRHHGRYDLHSHSKKDYDRHMAGLARAYLATKPDPALYGFLRLTFAQLQHRHGSVAAIVVPRPKLIPLSAAR